MDREQLRLPISRAIFYIFTKTALEILYDISIKTKNIQGVLSFSPIIKDTFMFFAICNEFIDLVSIAKYNRNKYIFGRRCKIDL